jgi:sulfur-oxidizing protein SoxY
MPAWLRVARRSAPGAAFAALLLAAAPSTGVAADLEPEDNGVWQRVRQSLFQARPIEANATGVLRLDAPVRAEDAAIVPISIHALVEQSATRSIDKIYLVIDHNPSPVAAVFRFTERSGRADIETRVRIEEYTHLRAIAEMSDGSLHMVTRWVKASGGCSAPAGKDAVAALANVGRMKMRVEEPVASGRPVQAQLMISHPNSSGLAMDQVTRLYQPPYFVRRVSVSYAGRPVMEADVDFSISENPNFRFFFVPEGQGELKAEVVDSRDLTFTDRIAVRPATGGAEGRAP